MRVYLPPDANCLLSVANHCLNSRNYVNVIVAGKHPAPQWLAMNDAIVHCTQVQRSAAQSLPKRAQSRSDPDAAACHPQAHATDGGPVVFGD